MFIKGTEYTVKGNNIDMKIFSSFLIASYYLSKVLLLQDFKYSWLVISNSKGLSETLRDIRTSKYQSCRSEENNKSNNHI